MFSIKFSNKLSIEANVMLIASLLPLPPSSASSPLSSFHSLLTLFLLFSSSSSIPPDYPSL